MTAIYPDFVASCDINLRGGGKKQTPSSILTHSGKSEGYSVRIGSVWIKGRKAYLLSTKF